MSETKTYLHNLDINRNKILNPLLNPISTSQRNTLASVLTLADQGYVCIDTNDNKQYVWSGLNWVASLTSVTWGSITGSISAQTDLTTYLSGTYYPLTNPAGYITSSALSPYLTSATAASTYYPLTNPSGYITASALSPYLTITSAASTYEPIITAGTTSQYWRGDKTWQTLPVYTLAGLGGVPTTRQLTINGTTYDLSADRSWTISTYTLPIATSTVLGGIKIGGGVGVSPDGTITVGLNGLVDVNLSSLSDGQSLVFSYSLGKWRNLSLPVYSLPIASSTVLGGVKIGSGISIAGDGTISVSSYTLPAATSSILGGVKIGTGVSVAVDGTISVSTNYQSPLSGSGIVKSTSGTISYISGTSSQFIKGDGSLDSNVVTSVGATGPITSSGGNTPTISTSMATNKLIGRSTSGVGVMEEISIGTGLSLSGGLLTNTINLSGYVPYTGANANVNLGAYSLLTTNLTLASTTDSTHGVLLQDGSVIFHTYVSSPAGLLGNIFLGHDCGNFTASGNYNKGFGRAVLTSLTSGSQNTGFGDGVLYANTSGQNNSGFGDYALYSNVNGSNNMGFGIQSLQNNTSGGYNIGIGRNSGQGITTGSNNTFIGNDNGGIVSGSGNVIIGANVNGLASDLSSNIILADNFGTIRYSWNGITNNFYNQSVTSGGFITVGGNNTQYVDGTGGLQTFSSGITTALGYTPSRAINIQKITGNTVLSLSSSVNTILVNGSIDSTINVTVPLASTAYTSGFYYTIKNIGGGSINILPTSTDLIDGQSSISISSSTKTSLTLAPFNDGSWYLI